MDIILIIIINDYKLLVCPVFKRNQSDGLTTLKYIYLLASLDYSKQLAKNERILPQNE